VDCNQKQTRQTDDRLFADDFAMSAKNTDNDVMIMILVTDTLFLNDVSLNIHTVTPRCTLAQVTIDQSNEIHINKILQKIVGMDQCCIRVQSISAVSMYCSV